MGAKVRSGASPWLTKGKGKGGDGCGRSVVVTEVEQSPGVGSRLHLYFSVSQSISQHAPGCWKSGGTKDDHRAILERSTLPMIYAIAKLMRHFWKL
jgi:hypothetical protein